MKPDNKENVLTIHNASLTAPKQQEIPKTGFSTSQSSYRPRGKGQPDISS